MKERRIRYERLLPPALAVSACCHLFAALAPAGAVDWLLRREAEQSPPVRMEVVELTSPPPPPEVQIPQGGLAEPPRRQIVGRPGPPQLRRSVDWRMAVVAPELSPRMPPSSLDSAPPAAPSIAANPDSTASVESYLAEVLANIERSRRYPETARRMGLQDTVRVEFEIVDGGRLNGPARLLRPSPHGALNRAARSSVERSAPFPPLPACLAGRRLEVAVNVVFHLQ